MSSLNPKLWDGEHDGPTNMGRDAALLDRLSPEVPFAARVYGWMTPWITLGAFQEAARDLRPDCPLPSVRRPTGGRAVLHGHDLTLGLAVSLLALAQAGESVDQLERAVRTVYRRVIAPLVEALNAVGVEAVLGEELRRQGSGNARQSQDCFAAISANDVVHRATGKKVGGCALRVGRTSALLQVSLPIQMPEVDPAQCFLGSAPVVPTPIDLRSFASAWEVVLEKHFSG